MTEATPTWNEMIGSRLRARREELELTQDEVARSLWLFGFNRSTVDGIERGIRDLLVPEFAAMLGVLDLTLPEAMTPGQFRVFEVTVAGQAIVDAFQGEAATRSWQVGHGGDTAGYSLRDGSMGAFGDALRRMAGNYTDAEMKAARNLGVEPAVISRAADLIWGQSLSEERDGRVSSATEPDAPKRTIQAARGHVTRALLAELKAHLEQEKNQL